MCKVCQGMFLTQNKLRADSIFVGSTAAGSLDGAQPMIHCTKALFLVNNSTAVASPCALSFEECWRVWMCGCLCCVFELLVSPP